MEQTKKSPEKAFNSTKSVLYYKTCDSRPLCVVRSPDQIATVQEVSQALFGGPQTIIMEKKNAEAVSGMCEGLIPGVSYLFVRSLETALARRGVTPAATA